MARRRKGASLKEPLDALRDVKESAELVFPIPRCYREFDFQRQIKEMLVGSELFSSASLLEKVVAPLGAAHFCIGEQGDLCLFTRE